MQGRCRSCYDCRKSWTRRSLDRRRPPKSSQVRGDAATVRDAVVVSSAASDAAVSTVSAVSSAVSDAEVLRLLLLVL